MKSFRIFSAFVLAVCLTACGKSSSPTTPLSQPIPPAPATPASEPIAEPVMPVPQTPLAAEAKRAWQFVCTQNGMVLAFDSRNGPDHLATPLRIYDQAIANPIDPKLPGEEMDGFSQVIPVSATKTELILYAYGRPIHRPKSLFAVNLKPESFFEVHVDLTNAIGSATPASSNVPQITPRISGQDPGAIEIAGSQVEITSHETIERGDSPSGWVLSRGELEIKSDAGDHFVKYPDEVFARFAINPHVLDTPVFQGLWAGSDEVYVSLTGELGQIVFRLTAKGKWSRLTDDHCESQIAGIESTGTPSWL